ncbi:hypothetical protein B6U91_00485 [Candidatus Pacearchaeota archaeon ex4484_71]|nr:MAG: hypothetical protein B6U91_00485 [Candidatus Pacearchaeota archaeon ex4484_71]
MGNKLFVFTIVFFFFSVVFVSADIISINSGGDNNLVINPGGLVEKFFLGANFFPNVEDVLLVSLNGRNESDTDLNCSAFISDSEENLLTVYVDWIKDGGSQFVQNFTNQANGTIFWALLDEGNLTLGDIWKCSVRTYDGYDYSSWVDSNELEIIDITPPNISIISPLPPSQLNYTSLDVDFNISIEENENISRCFYSLNGSSNISMNEINDSYFWFEPSDLTPGDHNVTFWCNDTSNNWGTNWTNFTILDEAAIAIQLSPSLLWNVNWSLETLPVDDLDAAGNNGSMGTEYWVNLSVTATTADLYVKADGDLKTAGLDILGLGNETFCYNVTNSSVPDINRLMMDTDYILIAENLQSGAVYLKFYLDAPAGQPAGTYLNRLDFKAVSHGNSP